MGLDGANNVIDTVYSTEDQLSHHVSANFKWRLDAGARNVESDPLRSLVLSTINTNRDSLIAQAPPANGYAYQVGPYSLVDPTGIAATSVYFPAGDLHYAIVHARLHGMNVSFKLSTIIGWPKGLGERRKGTRNAYRSLRFRVFHRQFL